MHAAHVAASWAMANSGDFVWLEEIPQWLIDCIKDDMAFAKLIQ